MHPTVRDILSRKTLQQLLPPGPLGTSGIAGDALNKLSAAYRTSLTFSKASNAIPAVRQPTSSNRRDLSDVEVEDAIGPLLDYLDANLQILSEGLTEPNLYAVLVRLWREIVAVIEGLIVPALSARPSTMQPLSDRELDVVLRWLKFMRDYFYAQGDGKGLPLEELQNYGYNDIIRLRIYYDWSTDDLMEECVKDFQISLSQTMGHRTRARTIRTRRNLQTIKQDRSARMKATYRTSTGEMLLRVLRMRRGASEFLRDQIQVLEAQRGTRTMQ